MSYQILIVVRVGSEVLELLNMDPINNGPLVSITKEQLEEYRESQSMLQALEAMGVDNWSGYYDAMEMHHKNYTKLFELS